MKGKGKWDLYERKKEKALKEKAQKEKALKERLDRYIQPRVRTGPG